MLDGSLEFTGSLPGSHAHIEPTCWQQYESKLFHNFRGFNPQSHESATFSTPYNVQNIINHVTGRNPSPMDGMIHSTLMHFGEGHELIVNVSDTLKISGVAQ